LGPRGPKYPLFGPNRAFLGPLSGPFGPGFHLFLGVLLGGPRSVFGPSGPENRGFRLYSKVPRAALLGRVLGCFWSVFGLFWPVLASPASFGSHRALPGPVFPGFGLFWACFRAFRPSFGLRPKRARILTDWLPGRGPGFPGFSAFSPLLAPFGPRLRRGPNPYRLVTGSWPRFSRVFGPFRLFLPLFRPSGPQTPVFGFTARSFWGVLALFGLFSPPPSGGGENRPSRGLPLPFGAPNVPLPALWGPKRAHSGPEAEIRRHPWAFLACFRSAKTSQKGPRMPPDFGLRPKRAPFGPPRAPNGGPRGPQDPLLGHFLAFGPF